MGQRKGRQLAVLREALRRARENPAPDRWHGAREGALRQALIAALERRIAEVERAQRGEGWARVADRRDQPAG